MNAALIAIDSMTNGRRDWTIISITDTRAVTKEQDGRYRPVGGTGESIPCECCGRAIEVHALASNRITGDRTTVGTRCAKKAGVDMNGINPLNRDYWKTNWQKRV